MKYLKNYSNYKDYNTLTNEEIVIINHILSINENVNESLLDKLKEVARKGALTTAMITTMLSSNPSFAKEYNNLPKEQKQSIESLIKDTESTDVDPTSFDISKSFNSGVSKLDDSGKQELSDKLLKLINYVNTNKSNKKYKLEIKASESKLRNKDIETGNILPAGELAKRRSEEIHKYINSFLSNYTNINLEIVKKNVIAGPENTGQNIDAFKPYQSVSLRLISEEISEDDFCGFDESINKTEIVNNIGFEKEFDVKNKLGTGDILMEPGSIPDRLVLYADGVKIGDTGFFASGSNPEIDRYFNYTPANIYALTDLYNKKSAAIQNAKLEIKHVNSFKELLSLMLKDNSKVDKDYSNFGRPDDIDTPIKKLTELFNKGQRDFIFYKKEMSKISYDLQGKYKKIKMVVYSPRDKSSFKVKVSCSKTITKK